MLGEGNKTRPTVSITTKTMSNFLQTPHGKDNMEKLCDALADLDKQRDRPEEFHVLWLCRSGKHLSVAGAHIGSWCVRFCKNYEVGSMKHAAQPTWPKSFCTKCDKCDLRQTSDVRRLYKTVFQMWEGIRK